MNVIRPGSTLRFRISLAARPTATRSRDSSSVTASASVSRSPSSAFSRTAETATFVTISSRLRHGAWHGDVAALDDADVAPRAGTLRDVTRAAHRRHGAWHQDV